MSKKIDGKRLALVLFSISIFLSVLIVNAAASTYGSDVYGSSNYGGGKNPADLNNDTRVDILDLITVATHFGLTPSSPDWNATADVVANSKIDIYDIVFVASRFT
jgi:hypothetical protein